MGNALNSGEVILIGATQVQETCTRNVQRIERSSILCKFLVPECGQKRIMELSFPRTFAPGSESSIGGTFVPWNFRSLELSFP